jgi:biotin/methionine sulfoxide reductase
MSNGLAKSATVSRRGFLMGATALGVAGIAAGRPGAALAQAVASGGTTETVSGEVMSGSHWGTFIARVQDGRIVRIVPVPEDPAPTPMIRNFPELVHGHTRIRQPMVRQSWLDGGPGTATERRGAEPFVPVDWDTALELVRGELDRVRETHGNQAIFGGSYGWGSAGRLHLAGTLTNRFLSNIGGYVGDETNYSYGAGMVLLPHVLGGNQAIGGPVTTWHSIMENTGLIVMVGGAAFKNGQITFGGMGEHTTEPWLRRVAAAGIPVVAINPVAEDETVELGFEWLAPRPGTDAALLLALTHTLAEEGLADLAFLERYTVGAEQVFAYLAGEGDGIVKDADWAAGITGLPADTIRALARRMAATRTMIMTAWSMQRAQHGEQTWWATVLLASALGQIGLPGGGFGFSYTSTNGIGAPRAEINIPGMTSGRNPLGLQIPVARIADLLLEPGRTIPFNGREVTFPEIKLIYWAGGNPFHHHQDLNRLVRAWQRPETIIVHEPWWTPTARRADIVLPVTTTLERNDISASARDRWIIAMKQAVAPVGEARSDFAIYSDLADRMGFGEAYHEGKDEMAWLRDFWQRGRERAARYDVALPDFEAFWEQGRVELPEGDPDYVFLEDFRLDPDARPLRTPSGRIELFSETIAGFGYADCPGHPAWLEPSEWLGNATAEAPLHMISSHPKHRLHSQMDQGPVAAEAKIQGREPCWVNPADAATRGIADGAVARLTNARGACLVGVRVTDRVRPGVIVLAEGAWFDPERPGEPGAIDKHGNPNMLTLDVGTSALGQGCTAQTTMVQLEAVDGPVPPVTAFDPPTTAA